MLTPRPSSLRPVTVLATLTLATACGSISDPGALDGGGGRDARPARPDAAIAERDGYLTYTLANDVYRLAARADAVPENVSAALVPGERAQDRRLNLSPGGTWYVLETSNVDPTCPLCLAVAPVDDLTRAELVRPDGEVVASAENLSAVSDNGAVVVFAAGGGPHARDLYRSRRAGDGWGTAVLLTVGSAFEWNDQPALHADGTRLVFDCGPEANAAGEGSSICEVDIDGGAVTVVASPADAPAGISHAGPLHHADYAPDGLVFEADWDGERVWRKHRGVVTPLTPLDTSNDNSPCVLPDGRVATVYLNAPGNPDGQNELKVMDLDGASATMVLRGHDVDDSGLGCGR